VKRRRAFERLLRLSYAPTLPIGPVVRLYRADAAGVQDEELLHDVAWRLYARCRDVLLISDSKVRCLECRTEFPVPWRGSPPDRVVACPSCGWYLTVAEYRLSYRGTTLQGPGARAVWTEYVTRFPTARTYQERMLLVDRLVHGVHTSRNLATKNLFSGAQRQVLAALDGLAGALTVDELTTDCAPHGAAAPRAGTEGPGTGAMTTTAVRNGPGAARSEIVLIGPMGAGKSTLAVLIAARLGVPCVSADFLSGAYQAGLGYDAAYARELMGRDFRAAMEYGKPFAAQLVEWLLAEHSGCVFDFGAGHVQHDDPGFAGHVERALAPFANVVHVLPSPERDASIRVLRQRRGPLVFHGFDLDAYAWDHPSYWRLATLALYTADRAPEDCADELLARIQPPTTASARTGTYANALQAAAGLAAKEGHHQVARRYLEKCAALRRELAP
jgi:hypothetical protein